MVETFRRYEKKYLLEKDQYENILNDLRPYIERSKFYDSQIRSIYYDTDKFQLIRRSIEKPEYKEKLRVRSYADAEGDDKVYVELKKKFDGIVYKRRCKAKCDDVLNDIYNCKMNNDQVYEEIKYALQYYGKLRPAIYIGCSRTSYYAKEDENLRITFDKDMKYRMKHLNFKASELDKPINDKVIMEIKIGESMPLWLSEILDKNKAYPRGFSKVGTAFLKEIKGE